MRAAERALLGSASPQFRGAAVGVAQLRRTSLWPLAIAALAAILAALGLAAQGARAAEGPLVGCPPGAECGVIRVPLDHAQPGRGTLGLAVARLRARARPGLPRNGAILFLTGGPGQAGIARDDPEFMRLLRVLSRNRDVVAVDVRGTGRSGALRCAAIDGDDPLPTETLDELNAAVAACAGQVGPGRRFFTTRQVVADLEVIRAALGISTWSVGGTSYGTYVATTYARLHPTRVAALLLDSPVAPGGVVAPDPLEYAASRRVMRALCGGGACAGITRNLVADVAAVQRRIEGPGVAATAVDSKGRARRVRIGSEAAGLLFAAFGAGDLAPPVWSAFPAAVRAARRGDGSMLVRLLGLEEDGVEHPTRLSEADFLATICNEANLPWAPGTPPAARRGAFDALVGAISPATLAPFTRATAALDPTVHFCVGWPETRISSPSARPLPDIPALILVGSWDTRTPVANARALQAQLSRSQVVVIPRRGHSLLTGTDGCVLQTVLRFFAGRRAGRCGPLPREIKAMPPVPPRSLAALAPTGRGLPGRTLTAVRRTLADAGFALAVGGAANAESIVIGTGLHGGRVLLIVEGPGGLKLRFERFSYIRGVQVSGTLDIRPDLGLWDGRLVVAGSAAAPGRLQRSLKGNLRGTLGGVAVRGPNQEATGTLPEAVGINPDDVPILGARRALRQAFAR